MVCLAENPFTLVLVELSFLFIRTCPLLLLFFDRMLDRKLRLQFRFQQIHQPGRVLLDALQVLGTLAEGYDLVGGRGPLRLVVSQGGRIGLMADPVSDF